jgi:hypothetical protein
VRCLHVTEKRADEIVREAVERLNGTDYRFSVHAVGPPWDVYYAGSIGCGRVGCANREGRPALIAVRIVKGCAEVGGLGEVYWDEDKMQAYLIEHASS